MVRSVFLTQNETIASWAARTRRHTTGPDVGELSLEGRSPAGATDPEPFKAVDAKEAKSNVEAGSHHSDETQKATALANELRGKTAVVIFACNRPDYLTRGLNSVLKYMPASGFDLFVSQDGTDAGVTQVVKSYAAKSVQHLQHIDSSAVALDPGHEHFRSYYLIARHYGWGLSQLFDVREYERVIILEDDLEIAPDFFEYMEAGARLLEADPTIWVVSAWNDNGHSRHVRDPKALYRSDFFPGLGWLFKRSLWRELGPIWAKAFWDDWMRRADIRKDRVSIRPEISRTFTFGEMGVSKGEYFSEHLSKIKLNADTVPFKSMDLSYLTKDKYDVYFSEWVRKATQVANAAAVQGHPDKELRIHYSDHHSGFVPLARHFGIMDDERAGTARTAYQGVVTFWDGDHRIFLVPDSWTGLSRPS